MLEEAGVPYRINKVRFATGDTRTSAFLGINPNGHIPVLQDGSLRLFESLAINLHIARCHAPHLWPEGSESELMQWTAWALAELEGPHDAANRTGSVIDAQQLDCALQALAAGLDGREWLLGERFTVADLNTAAVLMRPRFRPIAVARADIRDWFQRCSDRPALRRAFARLESPTPPR